MPKARVFESDKNPLLIVIPRLPDDHPRVYDFEIRQGRVNEFYIGSIVFMAMGRPAMRLKVKDGEPDTVDGIFQKLQGYVVPESKDFAMTDTGKAEIQKLAECIFNLKDK